MAKKVKIARKQSRVGSVKFNPSHNDIAEATKAFLKDGGKINQLKPDEGSFKNSLIMLDVSSEVDEFLLGQ